MGARDGAYRTVAATHRAHLRCGQLITVPRVNVDAARSDVAWPRSGNGKDGERKREREFYQLPARLVVLRSRARARARVTVAERTRRPRKLRAYARRRQSGEKGEVGERGL